MQGGRPATETASLTPSPPGWGKDTLSEFLEAARGNQFATFANKGDWYQRLAAVDELFVRVGKQWTNPKDMLAALLFLRCHSAFRAACVLVMAGQVVEASALHRSCLEYAAYALHINRNPSLGPLWLNRHQDDASIKEVRREFAVEKVRKTIAASDRHAAERFNILYQRAIDFGGHPNERGVMGSTQMEVEAGRRLIKQMYLHGDGLPLDHALKTTAQCGVVCLEILQNVFGALFELLGVHGAILEVRKGL